MTAITAARGYPPSGVPADPAAYPQERAVADAVAVLDGLGLPAAQVVGLSMGGFAALRLTLRHPDRVVSTVAACTGYGAAPDRQAAFRAECEAIAAAFETDGAEQVASWYALGPARVQFQNKNPRGWAEFAAALAGHSAPGSALSMRGVQAGRPSLYALRDELALITTPLLVVAGDEDESCLDVALACPRPPQPVLLDDRRSRPGRPLMITVDRCPIAPLSDRGPETRGPETRRPEGG